MKKLKLIFVGDSMLREKAAEVTKIDENIRETLNKMEKIMHEERGAGLAAPQVGLSQRMLLFTDLDKNIVYKVINPQILSRSEKIIRMEEGCLSIQGPDGPIFAKVERPETLVCEWTDENNEKVIKELSGTSARALLHEIDHLDGILFIDYLSSVKREMIIRKTKKRKLVM